MRKNIITASLFCMVVLAASTSNHLWTQTSLKGLEALLIVGPQQDGTKQAMEKMDKIALLFEEHGIKVHTFYDEGAKWNEIKKISPNCSFMVYAGHGTTSGFGGNYGGICIDSTISTERLLNEFRLKENALVMFKSVCGGAGSSASDDDDIGIEEAKNRVSNYAFPFFKIGASAYYANNFDQGSYNFLKDFLSGVSIQEAYKTSTDLWTTIEFQEPFSEDKTKQFSIASTAAGGYSIRTTYWDDRKQIDTIPTTKGYKIAFVGNPEFDINQLSGN